MPPDWNISSRRQLERIIAEHLATGAIRVMRDGTVVHVRHTVAAKLVRVVLKRRFPKTKFSVRCQRAAGGLHRTIIVAWDRHADSAPDREWVRDTLDTLDGYSYDTMTDSTIRREPVSIGRYTVQFEHWLLIK